MSSNPQFLIDYRTKKPALKNIGLPWGYLERQEKFWNTHKYCRYKSVQLKLIFHLNCKNYEIRMNES